MSDNGESAKAERLKTEFVRAVRNSVQHAKRSLLDFMDFQRTQLSEETMKDPRIQAVFEFMKRRIHNDVSVIEHQAVAAFEIYASGGFIPAFGRLEEEIARSSGKSHP